MKLKMKWISAGFIAGLLFVACSPTDESYPKAPDSTSSGSNLNNTSPLSADPQSQLSGIWTCKSGQTCTYSMISISKNGNAAAVGSIGDSDCEFQHNAKTSLTHEANQFHLELAVSESGTVLNSGGCGKISSLPAPASTMTAVLPASQPLTELKLSPGGDQNLGSDSPSDIYVRKSQQ